MTIDRQIRMLRGQVSLKGTLAGLLAVGALIAVVLALQFMTPIIVGDYHEFTRPTTLAFLSGRSNLYDANSSFYNAPWSIAIWLPFVSYPYVIGQSAHYLVYIGCVVISLWLFQKELKAPRLGVWFAVLTFPVFVLIVAAGIDSVILLGTALGYIAARRRNVGLLAVALFVLAAKPQNVALVAALFLYTLPAWRAVLLTFGAVIVSGMFIGLDWIWRLGAYLQANPPIAASRIELWSKLPTPLLILAALVAVGALAGLVHRDGFNDITFGLAIATNLVFGIYVLWSHFVGLVPVVLVIARRDIRLAGLLYLCGWFFIEPMVYPIAAFLILWGIALSGPTDRVKMRVTGAYSL